MGVYDTFMWGVRMAFVIIVITILVILLSFTIPKLDAHDLRADIYAARVVYNGGFSEAAGVVNASSFTQETADEHMHLWSELAVPVAVMASLETGAETLGPIMYNKEAATILGPQTGLRGVTEETFRLPVAVLDSDGARTTGVLVLEVVYRD